MSNLNFGILYPYCTLAPLLFMSRGLNSIRVGYGLKRKNSFERAPKVFLPSEVSQKSHLNCFKTLLDSLRGLTTMKHT